MDVYSALIARAAILAKLGYQYSGDRDIYTALGYSTTLTYDDYLAQYTRQDIAKAIIDRPVKATWRNGFSIVETEDYRDTPLEQTFRELSTKLSLSQKFSRLDRLTGIGKYGVLLLGLSDVKRVSDWEKPVSGVGHDLLYVMSYGEGSVKISEYVTDSSNERYGQPLFYSVSVQNLSTNTFHTLRVHWSRCIHVIDDPLESEIEGTPRLEAVFNRLKDLEKVVGASAEMFWRGARPGYQGKVDPEYTLTQEMRDELQEQVDEYEHNLRRLLLLEGIELEGLNPQVVNPLRHVDIQIQMISAATGIPKRILTGSEVGELASTEDKNRWFELIESRRCGFAEWSIIRPFIDRCIEYGVLPSPKEKYCVRWPDLWTMGDKEKAEIGRIRATALKEYSSMPFAESVVPPGAFLKVIMGLRSEEIALIEEHKQNELLEEEYTPGETLRPDEEL